MLGRLRFYQHRLVALIRSKGLKQGLIEAGRFLWRRKFFLGFLIEDFEYQILSRFRDVRATQIKILQSDLGSLHDKILIYVSFDQKSELKDHVVQQLKAFYDLGYRTIFVTTSPEMTEGQQRLIQSFCALIVHRKNQGYDFGSWRLGYLLGKDKVLKAKSLILMNDSCLGPYFDLGPSITLMQGAQNTVFGITKSYEITEYLQSYFFHFSADLIANGTVEKFFDRIRILNTKWGVVRFFELGSSKVFLNAGVKLSALVDPKDPVVANEMNKLSQADPVQDPVGTKWIKLGLSPFYKRSNLKQSG